MALSPTLTGDLTVGLVRDGYQYRRSVKVLVARAFVFGETSIFNTPILLDNDKNNLHASNIKWRPRWFAWKYAKQFQNIESWFYHGPVIDTVNGVEFEHIFEAAVTNGQLCSDIRAAIPSETHVFPTGEKYSYLYSKNNI
jgi:hypothetical protein